MLKCKQKWDSDCERKLNLYAEIYLKVGLSDLICVYRFFVVQNSVCVQIPQEERDEDK